jgi:hypothetical protein
VQDEENLFGISASERMQKTIAEHKTLLTGSQNGWLADYYPEKKHSVGGYTMFLKFLADGRVTASCETATNVPAHTADTSQYDVFAEQGPILSFSTYNRVMHYFSEPLGSSDVDGRSGDYEFVFMKVVSPDEIHLKGKKQGNRLVLRRNNDIDPDVYYEKIKEIENEVVEFSSFRLLVNNRVIDSLDVSQKTMSGDSVSVAYTFTPEGIRLYEPLVIDGVTMLNFKWNPENNRYECTDSGVNAYFEGYYPPDFQLKYDDFLGEWEMQYHGSSRTVWSVETVTVSPKRQYYSFTLSCDRIFSFPGIELTYNRQKGTISLINQSIDFSYGYSDNVRVLAYDRNAGYLALGLGSIGLNGEWNNDENGSRQIRFVDNKIWEVYKPDGFYLRLYSGNTNNGDFTANIGGRMFNDITLTKK